jgi:hypothetical protein
MSDSRGLEGLSRPFATSRSTFDAVDGVRVPHLRVLFRLHFAAAPYRIDRAFISHNGQRYFTCWVLSPAILVYIHQNLIKMGE